MRRLLLLIPAALAAMVFAAGPALAVDPGTYTPTSDSFNSANAPGSSHLTSGTVQCVVDANLNVNCSPYVLGGVGHTNASVDLAADYSATIDCTNKGGNLVESHTADFSASTSATVTSSRNGQLSVPAQSVSPFSAPQVCPNPNWTPSIRAGTLSLDTFTYTLTFAGFASPYITITAS
jgi:opacity protein-like surface antigen